MGIVINEDAILYDSGDSWERNQREKEYLDYIANHIANVKKAYELYFKPLLESNFITTLVSTEELHKAILQVGNTIDTHDASKFGDLEFDGYRAKYYPTQKEKNGGDEYQKKVKDDYDQCWIHHYTVNEHHPEHWVERGENGLIIKRNDMSLAAIVEMLCDWEGMSLAFKSSTIDWYNTQAIDEKECLSEATKTLVEELLFKVLHN